MSEFYLALFCLGFVVVVLSLVEEKISRSPTTDPMIALFSGILVGPHVLGWIDPSGWGNEYRVFHFASSLTIAMALMATALRLPRYYFVEHWKSMTTILLGGMVLMWLFSFAVIYLLTGLGVLFSLLIAAAITPTDPVVASTIVSGKVARRHLPAKVRHFISAESGANDGLALCVVFLPLLLITHTGINLWWEWVLRILLWQNVVAIVLGYFIGYTAGVLVSHSLEKNITDVKAFLAFTISLGFMVLGLMEIIHCNGIIAVFAAGIGLGHKMKGKRDELEAERVQEMMERLFTIPIFVLLGAVLPWGEWQQLGLTAPLLVVGILLFRRLPMLFVLQKGLPGLNKKKDLWFIGWFGPVGVAALYYAAVSSEKTGMDSIWNITTLVVFGSVLVHGITCYLFSKKYAGLR